MQKSFCAYTPGSGSRRPGFAAPAAAPAGSSASAGPPSAAARPARRSAPPPHRNQVDAPSPREVSVRPPAPALLDLVRRASVAASTWTTSSHGHGAPGRGPRRHWPASPGHLARHAPAGEASIGRRHLVVLLAPSPERVTALITTAPSSAGSRPSTPQRPVLVPAPPADSAAPAGALRRPERRRQARSNSSARASRAARRWRVARSRADPASVAGVAARVSARTLQ